MIGTVYKIHSDFYYVMPDKKEGNTENLVECKLREILKKQKVKIVAGDFVEFEPQGLEENNVLQGAIVKVLKRKNFIPLCWIAGSLPLSAGGVKAAKPPTIWPPPALSRPLL